MIKKNSQKNQVSEEKDEIKKDVMLINSVYIYPQKIKGEWHSDALLAILKENNEKKFVIFDSPKITFYMVDANYFDDKEFKYENLYVPIEKLKKITCEYNNIVETIIKNLPPKEQKIYRKQLENGASKRKILNSLHKNRFVHGSDIDIEDYYYYKVYKKYGDSQQEITKAYLDIEVNSYEFKSFVGESDAFAPVSHISLFNEEDKTMYTFLLKFKKIKETNFTPEKLEDYKEQIIKRQSPFGLENVKFFIFEEDQELKMIKAYFKLVNELKPDVIGVWNLKFDICYLLNRVSYLEGVEFEDSNNYTGFGKNKIFKFSSKARNAIIPKEFRAFNHCIYSDDTSHQDYADKGSYFKYAGYSVYLDMMLIYANMNKGDKKEAYSLDFIADLELKDRKDKITGTDDEESMNMSNFIFRYYNEFTMYNIHDVMLLKRIEDKTTYINITWGVSQLTSTRIHKAMKKTICLKNFGKKKLEEIGIILSNNRNQTDFTPTKKIEEPLDEEEIKDDIQQTKIDTGGEPTLKGAFVADPNLLENVGTELFEGIKSNKIFDTVIDEDLVSLYPKVISAFNIDPLLQIGKISLQDKDGFDATRQFISDFISQSYIEIGAKYFGLPTINDILKEIRNE